MKIKAFKYLSPVVVYILASIAFTQNGWLCWAPMLYAWVLLPLIELLAQPNIKNMGSIEEEMAKSNRIYDSMLYIIVGVQFIAMYKFLTVINQPHLLKSEIAGRVFSMGLLCGTFAINVGHELGHRINKFEQVLAKSLLLSSLYMHFFIEHNKGHHKNVATPQDPSSARLNEPLYIYFLF
jgi:alkane 1-monooxygenase